jgi:urea transport system ATP-binding protein
MKLHKELGITLVLTEQHIKIAKAMSDKFVILDTGRVVSAGASRDLTKNIIDKHLSI